MRARSPVPVWSWTAIFPEAEEAWNEISFEIPTHFLLDGANRFRLQLWPGTTRTTEMYYMWFLQAPGPLPAAAPNGETTGEPEAG